MSFYLNPKNWPIMVKISLALLAVSLIPVISVAYYNLSSSATSIEKTEYRNLELLAAATAERLDQLMLDNVIAASQLASDHEIMQLISSPNLASNEVRDSVDTSMTRLLTTNKQYEYVYIIDQTGKVILSKQLDTVPSVQGQTFSNRAYFIEAMKGKPYIDVLVGRASKKLGFYFSAPIPDDKGKPIGVAIIKLKGEAITDIVNQFKTGKTGYAFLVDQDGVIVSHPNPKWYYHSLQPLSREAELKIGQRFMLPGCEDSKNLVNCKVESLNLGTLASSINSSREVRNATYTLPSDGSERIVGLANTRTQLNWSVGVDESRLEFTRPIALLASQTMLSVLVIGALAIIIGYILARLITQPLGKLSQVAESIQMGKTLEGEGFASVMEQGDEVGQLAKVFNNMINALKARVSELHTINVVSRTITSSFNIGTTLTLVLNSVRKVVPYDRALVLLHEPERDEFITRATADGRGFHLNRVFNDVDRPAVHTRAESHIQQFYDKSGQENFGVLVPDIRLIPESEQEYASEWDGFEPRSYLGVPLLFKDEIIGVIELASDEPGKFTPDHQRVLELIAGQAAVAVRNALDVEVREKELRKQIDELQIVIDEGKKQKYVAEIVESDFFQELTNKAKQIRQKRKDTTSPEA